MSLQERVTIALKSAMKLKDSTALTALRSVKSAILLAKTQSGSKENLSEIEEVKLLQKLIKQRRDSAEIFSKQNRSDLATPELDEAEIISQFLPEMMSDSEVEKFVIDAINDLKAEGMKDMGKVMGFVTKKLSGKSDGKTISFFVKKRLNN